MPNDYQYHNGYNYGSGGNRRNDGDLGGWIPVLIFLFCFPPVGVVLLVLKLTGIIGKGSQGSVGRHPYDVQRGTTGSAAASRRYYREDAAARTAQSAGKKPKQKQSVYARKPDRDPGKGLTIGGGIMAAFFGLMAGTGFLAGLSSYSLWEMLAPVFMLLGLCGVGLFMMYTGLTKSKRAKRYRKYLALIGKRDSISVTTLAQAMGVSVHRACDDLQDMLDDGLFPTGYLDMSTGRLVLTDEGIQDPAPEPEEKEEVPKGMEREEAVLTEIRQVNDAIADPTMSAKIDRIGEITGKIFGYLRDKPDKEGQLRSFLSYYLPTTLKILRAYAQMEAQGIEGENITAAKARIERMMDKVVDGFEKQLDKLFQDDAMDITTDVEVLERMLDKDGLGGQGMTMGG